MPSTITLGGLRMTSAPSEVRWDYQMITADPKTLTGKVIQILGVELGDMRVTGRWAPDQSKGDKYAWEEMLRWRDQVKKWTSDLAADGSKPPLRFTYPDRGWDFDVYIKQITPQGHKVTDVAPEYTFTLVVVEDAARRIKKGIKDLYIQRLMEGVGWTQTDYNGPSESYVSEVLAGRSVGDYLASLAQEAFDSGLSGSGMDQ